MSDPKRVLARGLWDCMVEAGADVSAYANETVTAEGRDAGFEQWRRMRTCAGMAEEACAAVSELRECYDEAIT